MALRPVLGGDNFVTTRLDKVIGWCLQDNVPTEDKAVLTTGRSSSEMVLKSVRAGIPIIVSHSAPTSLAVELAEKLNATLVGFARGRRMNIYSHGFRIDGEKRR